MRPPTRADTFIEVHGHPLRVSDRGDGPPLLLIMGLGGNIELWESLRRQLSGWRTIAYDAPGTGESPTAGKALRMPALARLAAGVLERMNVENADVLGYSFGGAVAQQLAHQHPVRVNRLILASTSYGIGALPPSTAALMGNPLRFSSAAHLRGIASYLYGDKQRHPEQVNLLPGNLPQTIGYAHQLMAIATWSSLPWLSQISHPTLVIAGDDDPIAPLPNARMLARRIPNAQLHISKDAGHLLLLDDPEQIAPAIRQFLSRQPTALRS